MALVGTVSADNPLSFKNLIINGDMRIAQRGTSFTATGYTVDRFGLNEDTDGEITVTQSTEAPTNFKYSLKVDVTTADTSLSSTQNAHFYQNIEGLNLQHLFFGSANAQTVTLSFWVRSNKTGTYSIVLENSAANRCYVSDYSISSANTWEQKSITIDGDTSGTWLITNGVGLRVRFGLASGTTYTTSSTNQWIASDMVGSTNMVNLLDSTDNEWYLTGVQLEVGSVATPFERRPYGTELSLCQRYYYKEPTNAWHLGLLDGASGNYPTAYVFHPVEMRAQPTTVFESLADFYYNNSATAFFVPSGGTTSYGGNTRLGTSRKNEISNGPGSSHAQKAGQWIIQLSFSAEL